MPLRSVKDPPPQSPPRRMANRRPAIDYAARDKAVLDALGRLVLPSQRKDKSFEVSANVRLIAQFAGLSDHATTDTLARLRRRGIVTGDHTPGAAARTYRVWPYRAEKSERGGR